MAGELYKPFPYFGSQVLVASQRIHLHAREDSVLITARRSIALSSLGTLNVDCDQKVTLNSPRIDLGLNANQQVILGTLFFSELEKLLTQLNSAGTQMTSIGESNIADAIAKIAVAGKAIKESTDLFKQRLQGMLSTTTYTV